MARVKVKCKWCRKELEVDSTKGKYGYTKLKCPHCGNYVSSSIKEPTDNITGKKHVHRDLKSGDLV